MEIIGFDYDGKKNFRSFWEFWNSKPESAMDFNEVFCCSLLSMHFREMNILKYNEKRVKIKNGEKKEYIPLDDCV